MLIENFFNKIVDFFLLKCELCIKNIKIPLFCISFKDTKCILIMEFSNLEEGDEKIGRWTQEEHKSFIEAVNTYGKNWRKVANHIGTRNPTQVRSHAQKHFLREHAKRTLKDKAREHYIKASMSELKIEKIDASTQYGEGVCFSTNSLKHFHRF